MQLSIAIRIDYHVGTNKNQDSCTSREREKPEGDQAVRLISNTVAAVHALKRKLHAMTVFSNLATAWKSTASLPANAKNWYDDTVSAWHLLDSRSRCFFR